MLPQIVLLIFLLGAYLIGMHQLFRPRDSEDPLNELWTEILDPFEDHN